MTPSVEIFISDGLFFQHVSGYEEDVGGALGEAAHEVGVPLVAEGNVDADVVAFFDELLLEVATDAVEHLEFEAGGRDVVFFGVGFGGFDHFFIVCGEAVIEAG